MTPLTTVVASTFQVVVLRKKRFLHMVFWRETRFLFHHCSLQCGLFCYDQRHCFTAILCELSDEIYNRRILIGQTLQNGPSPIQFVVLHSRRAEFLFQKIPTWLICFFGVSLGSTLPRRYSVRRAPTVASADIAYFSRSSFYSSTGLSESSIDPKHSFLIDIMMV